MTQQALRAVFLGGMIAGAIDIFAPVVINSFRFGPSAVLKYIAGGLIGLSAAHAGGLEIAGLGLLLQWMMSLLIALIYAGAARRLRSLDANWIAAGIAYGTAVFLVMNYVVVPASMIGRAPAFSAYTFIANLVAMWLFGLIIAWFTQRQLRHA